MNTNEYLQTEVMGECWCEFDTPLGAYCIHCGSMSKYTTDDDGVRTPIHRDFSTDSDYCALEDKMTELGEWGYFIDWVENERQPEIIWLDWQYLTRAQRAELIAEYWRSRK